MKVYMRRNWMDKAVDDQKTNPDLPTLQNFLNDPSCTISEEGSETCCDDEEGVQSAGQHIRYEQNTPYPIDWYVSYTKVSKNFKCFISAMTNVILRSLVEAQCDPKCVNAIREEIKALTKNNTWDVVSIPEGAHPDRCK